MLKKGEGGIRGGRGRRGTRHGEKGWQRTRRRTWRRGVLDSSHQILARRARRLLAGETGRRQAVRDPGEAGRADAGPGPERRTSRRRRPRRGALATATAKEVQQMAGGTWDKLEQVFEDRVARALSKLGVYTQNDVQRLAARVDGSAAAVNQLVKAPAGGAAKPARRTRTCKTADAPVAKARNGRRSNAEIACRALFAVELLDLLDVALHRLFLARPFELSTRRRVSRRRRSRSRRDARRSRRPRRLLVERIELEQRRVVRLLFRLLRGRGGGLELRLEVDFLRGGHRAFSSGGHSARAEFVLL